MPTSLVMIMRKWKRRAEGRKIRSIFLLVILPAWLAHIFIISAYFTVSKSSAADSRPIYEEIYSVKEELTGSITKIDYAIYESLFRSGTQEKDIFFLDVQPRHKKGYVWDFTELYIKCGDIQSALNLQNIIVHEITSLGPKIVLTKEKTSEGNIILHIFANDLYTHKIILRFDGYKQATGAVRPKIAIIIDDLGYNSNVAFSFIHLDLLLSFSVLPSAPFTEIVACEANKEGCEILLHLPMEPKNYPSVNPGPGALLLSMDKEEIRQILDRDLKEIPGARGVSNHMGSLFTEDYEKMLIVLNELKKRNLYFIDSRTSSDTVGFSLARRIGLQAARRSVFLDNDPGPKAIRMQMERLLNIARHTGAAIGIGHPYKETLEILKEYYSILKTEYRLVRVSELVS
jgi:polysaccharide deacetylase 2 family uncharacterized protein YibQ